VGFSALRAPDLTIDKVPALGRCFRGIPRCRRWTAHPAPARGQILTYLRLSLLINFNAVSLPDVSKRRVL
jgi:hypothetical protein